MSKRLIITRANSPPEREASASESGWHSAYDVALGIFERILKEKEAREREACGNQLAPPLDHLRRASEARRV